TPTQSTSLSPVSTSDSAQTTGSAPSTTTLSMPPVEVTSTTLSSTQTDGPARSTSQSQSSASSTTTIATMASFSTSVPLSESPPRAAQTTPPSVASDRQPIIIGSVLGVLLFILLMGILLYLHRRRGQKEQTLSEDKGFTSFKKKQMISNRPWYQSPAYSFSQTWTRSKYTISEFSSTSGSDSMTHRCSSSEVSSSTITPSDSVSQIGYSSKAYKFQIKRKPLRTFMDLSAVPEPRGNGDSTSADSSTMVSGSDAANRPKPTFPDPIPVIITESATPQTSVVG
ncbi:hypothetical protein AAF712_015237, partial [Marasmius tenuissimus]